MKSKKKREAKYDPKLAIDGTFDQVLKVSVTSNRKMTVLEEKSENPSKKRRSKK